MADSINRCRWLLKKVARKGLAITARASGWLAARGAAGAGPRVRALTYHRFGECRRDPFCVSPADFDAQMRHVAEHGLAASLEDVEAFVAGHKDLRDGSVLVTVDDGFRSVYTEMLPVLERYAIPAVAYVTATLIQDRGASRAEGGAAGNGADGYLTWTELERLAAQGVAVGSHGWTHRSLAALTPDEARDEAARSREVLESRLGCRVASFAYPYGTRIDFNDTTAGMLADSGYTSVFTSQHGAIIQSANPIELPRIKVEGGEGLWMFRLLSAGAMDGWRLVDRALWRWQRAAR
jgi:peptidoglycan/xylan/chitin deacetylase (PgdA/CDA1 family)